MPITTQQLLHILPNAGQSAGVFVSALNTAMNQFQIVGGKIKEMLFALDLYQHAIGRIIRHDHLSILAAFHQVSIGGDI